MTMPLSLHDDVEDEMKQHFINMSNLPSIKDTASTTTVAPKVVENRKNISTSTVLNGGELKNNNNYNNHHLTKRQQQQQKKGLDFIIAAFPKCATSTLQRKVLQNHDEIIMLRKTKILTDGREKLEEYVLQNKQKVMELFQHIEQTRSKVIGNNTNRSDEIKLGIKWPRAIVGRYVHFLEYMREFNPSIQDPKIIIGMRHPIRWFESLYNFALRVGKDVPSRSSLKHVHQQLKEDEILQSYIELAQFEKHIMQLGLQVVETTNPDQLQKMGIKHFVPTTNKVFLYAQEQFENETLAEHMFDDLRIFLDLNKSIDKHLLGNHVHAAKDVFDICSEKYYELRSLLVKNGNITSTWIRDKLAYSKDVIIGGREDFLELIKSWSEDPCL